VRLAEVTLPFLPGYPVLAAPLAWRTVAGPYLAARSRAFLGRDGVLHVAVPDERWVRSLEGLAAYLLRRIQKGPGGDAVRVLRFHVKPGLAPDPRTASTGVAARGETRGTWEERWQRVACGYLARQGPGEKE
jgi:hypothetical protein